MSQRPDQVASVLQRAVQQTLTQGLSDPRVRGLISVTDVQLSPDGTQATVLISIHPEEHAELSMHGIQHAARHIRGSVARQVNMRRIPRLIFKQDRSIKVQSEVLRSIQHAIGDEESTGDPEEDVS